MNKISIKYGILLFIQLCKNLPCYEIWGSYGGDYEDYYISGYDALQFGK
jgi:hypothetical protein